MQCLNWCVCVVYMCVPLCVYVCVCVDFVSSAAAEKLCMQFARTPPSAANVFN